MLGYDSIKQLIRPFIDFAEKSMEVQQEMIDKLDRVIGLMEALVAIETERKLEEELDLKKS